MATCIDRTHLPCASGAVLLTPVDLLSSRPEPPTSSQPGSAPIRDGLVYVLLPPCRETFGSHHLLLGYIILASGLQSYGITEDFAYLPKLSFLGVSPSPSQGGYLTRPHPVFVVTKATLTIQVSLNMADTGPYTIAPATTVILPEMAKPLASLPSYGIAQPTVSANRHLNRFVHGY